MKKFLCLFSIISLACIMSCGDDEPDTPPDLAAPGLTASTTSLNLDAGQTIETTVSLVAEAGVAQFRSEVSDPTVITVTITGEPTTGDTDGTISLSIEALDIGAATITLSIQDAEGDTDELTIQVTVVAGPDFPFSTAYEILELIPQYSDMKFVIDGAGQADIYRDLAGSGTGAETFFYFADGWLNDYIDNSPFITDRNSMTPGQLNMLAGMFRSQQRDNDAVGNYYRNNLVWETLTSATGENVDLGTTASFRNVGVVGNSVIQTVVRPMAYIGDAANAQIGTFPVDSETPTARANAFKVNIKVQETDTIAGANGATVPYGIVHAFDGFPADIDAAFADPQAYVEAVQGRSRNYRDVSIIQNLMLVDPDVKWTMNAIEDNTGNYSGSSAMYGVVIVSESVFDDINAILSPINGSFALGQTRTGTSGNRTGQTISAWQWDSGAGHIPEDIYSAAADYWFKHWIPTEVIEDGALADGTYPNFAGDNITLNGSTLELGGTTVNVVKRFRYKDERTGRYDRADDGSSVPSQAYFDATAAQGFKWVEVIIVDSSF